MYCQFFGFSERPFELSPDPNFLYLTPNHRETLASLIYGIEERRGIISITGEVGTGKTTLLNTLFEQLSVNTKVAYIFNTGVDFDELLKMILIEFELTSEDINLTRAISFQYLNIFAIDLLSSNGNVAIVIDEAQNLDRWSLESLRLLSNLETPKHKLIQIVLSGQPELAAELSRPELRQLDQRISLKRHIFAFTEEETYKYIHHRLSIANYKGNNLFSHSSLKSIWRHSEGIPRKINILCDNALLIAFGVKKNKINLSIIDEVVSDLRWSVPVEDEKYQISTLPQLSSTSETKTSNRGRLIFAFFAIICILSVIAGTIYYENLKTYLAHNFNVHVPNFSELIKSPISDPNKDTLNSDSLHKNDQFSSSEQHPNIAGQVPFIPDATLKSFQPFLENNSSENGFIYNLNNQATKVNVSPNNRKEKESVYYVSNSMSSPYLGSNSLLPETTVVERYMTEREPTVREQSAQIDKFTKEYFHTISQINFPPIQLVKPISLYETTIIVQKNDTLHDIIERHYGVFDTETYQKLLDINPFITDPDVFDIGQIIILPSE